MSTKTPAQTYSPREAAAILGLTRNTIYRMLQRRLLTAIPGLRHKRIPKSQIDRLLGGGEGDNHE